MTLGAPPRPATGSLMLLAPRHAPVPNAFRTVEVDSDRHEHFTMAIQRLRGSVYMEDGAISQAHLSPDGRHIQDADQHSWHVLSVDEDGNVCACARYRPHAEEVRPEDLGVWQAALAQDPHWQSTLRNAIANEIDRARRLGVAYVEVGGWAVSRLRRGTTHAFETAVSSYALASGLGGCIGITTATVRHCSSRILRKLGGHSLQAAGVQIPSYFDPRYGCEMEILGFDSRSLNRRYGAHIDRMFAKFAGVPVIASAPVFAPAEMRKPVVATMAAALAEFHLPRFIPQDAYAAGAA
jgi:hypothetical protein